MGHGERGEPGSSKAHIQILFFDIKIRLLHASLCFQLFVSVEFLLTVNRSWISTEEGEAAAVGAVLSELDGKIRLKEEQTTLSSGEKIFSLHSWLDLATV